MPNPTAAQALLTTPHAGAAPSAVGHLDMALALAVVHGVVAAALAVTAGALALSAARRGQAVTATPWVLALALAAGGAAVAGLLPEPWSTALALPLLLQWPLLALTGLRRFQPRLPWPGGGRVEGALLLALLPASLAMALLQPPASAPAWTLIALLAHGWPAVALFQRPMSRDDAPLLVLGVSIGLAALWPGLAALWAGATGWLPWPPLTGLAVSALLGGLVLLVVAQTLMFDRAERQWLAMRRRLRTLANLDSLTQLPNRRHFQDLARRALAHDPPGSTTVLVFDIDHFKQINDRHGHATGDLALCAVAHALQAHLRVVDIAGRQGGDEFALMLRRSGRAQALAVASRIADAVLLRTAEALPTPVSLSFGLVEVQAGESLDAALRRADQALYEAKRQGRSCVVTAQGDEARPVFSESQRLGLTPH